VLAGILLKLGRIGVLRILSLMNLNLRFSLLLFICLSILSSGFTCANSDTKKIVAYRRVTHITFIIVGVVLNIKILIFIVVLLSLAHG
jgi:NADH:ubiquinone oxidoreductase subunit 4 (subunit M)